MLTLKISQEVQEVDGSWGSYDLGRMLYDNKTPKVIVTGATSKFAVPILQPGCIHVDIQMREPKGMARLTTCKLVCIWCREIVKGYFQFELTDDFSAILKCYSKTQPPPKPLNLGPIGTLQSTMIPNWLSEFHEESCRRTKAFDLIQTSYDDGADDPPTYLEH